MAAKRKPKKAVGRGVGATYKELIANAAPPARTPKAPKVPSFMRSIVGENIQKRMEYMFRESTNRPMALARKTGPSKEGGLSFSTVQRIIAGTTGATLDNLEAIADALDLSLYQLMIPALDPENPQIIPGAMQDEERMYKRWKRGQDIGKHPAYIDAEVRADNR